MSNDKQSVESKWGLTKRGLERNQPTHVNAESTNSIPRYLAGERYEPTVNRGLMSTERQVDNIRREAEAAFSLDRNVNHVHAARR